ncbi:Retrovirus-related Pol polyprotein from transposon TNT 1-94 [Gossypium australe]|uniref:Retrovirus-related Pol polyprotein from transposon TNT 1-94 n=1 Tax=Gossypium australe TaxID=47621 RepID=A0A5B6WMU9_9ROSI|nr:Retrovirus-related Pol polyprotein from transposon TNT 1-94 [Gossypium australe]
MNEVYLLRSKSDALVSLISHVYYALHLPIHSQSFATHISSMSKPQTYTEAISDPRWVDAMQQEIRALEDNVVEKGYNQQAGIDFQETFSLVVKHVTVRTVINVATMNDWPLFQMDVYNAFLQGDLYDEVYMDISEGSDIGMINEIKMVLHQNFKMKDLGALKFFLGIEVIRSSKAEAEYRSMAVVVAKVVWLDGLLKEICPDQYRTSLLFSDSRATLQIASNPVFHERTKYIEIGCHFIRDKIREGLIQM